MTLYEITGDILTLYQMLEDGADETTVNDTLEAVMDDFKDKADGYGAFIRQLEAEINAYDAEIERFIIRKRIAKNAVDNMKSRLLAAMDATGTEEIKGDLFKFKPRNNAPQLPKDITLEDLSDDIRDTYTKIEKSMDKKALLADVKAGKVTGIDLVRSRSLMMK